MPCSTLPRINLSLWTEEACYFRVNVPSPNSIEVIESFSRTSKDVAFTCFPQTVSAKKHCIPVEYPGIEGSSELALYSITSNYNYGLLKCNKNLPPNTLNTNRGYYAMLPKSVFGQGAGLYKSLSVCEDSSTAAFTIKSRLMAQEIGFEQRLLEQLNRQTSSQSEADPSKNDDQVPKFILNVLEKPSDSPSTPSPSLRQSRMLSSCLTLRRPSSTSMYELSPLTSCILCSVLTCVVFFTHCHSLLLTYLHVPTYLLL